MLRIELQAPYAAFRPFSAGWYRTTAGFLTPSAAYGLALNLAGVETRQDDGTSAMTVTRLDLPPARIALGAVGSTLMEALPTVQTIYQQLHNYPVGASGKQRKDDTKGNKYNITPVRREFLARLRALVALEFPNHPEVEVAIRLALDPTAPQLVPRYGLPFVGDNNFLIDKLIIRDQPAPAFWFCRLDGSADGGTNPASTRLTTWVDRRDMSQTRSFLFAPQADAVEEIPNSAWSEIEPLASPSPLPPTSRSQKDEAKP